MQWPWLDYQTKSGDEAAEKHHVNWTDEIIKYFMFVLLRHTPGYFTTLGNTYERRFRNSYEPSARHISMDHGSNTGWADSDIPGAEGR